MTNTRNTGTAILDEQGRNRTATHVSTNISIVVDGGVIGAIQKIDLIEGRGAAKMIDEVGTDGHIDSVPIKSSDITGNCTRIRFDKKRIAQAFHRGFVHAKCQRVPFDIEIHDFFNDSDPDHANTIITVVRNVWISKISYAYSATEFTISESMEWTAEDIYSVMGNGDANVVPANNEVIINPFERNADNGKYLGALDAAGLINAFNEIQ